MGIAAQLTVYEHSSAKELTYLIETQLELHITSFPLENNKFHFERQPDDNFLAFVNGAVERQIIITCQHMSF